MDISKHVVDRPALGRVAQLGDLFDARSETFLNISIFKRALPPCCIKPTDNDTSNIDFLKTDSLTEKFGGLNVNGGFKLSLLSGLLPVEGSGKYFQDEKSNSKSFRSVCLYSVSTKTEQLQIYREEFLDCISKNALQPIEGDGSGTVPTHVVVRIDWGAKIFVTAEQTLTNAASAKEVKGSINATLNKAFSSINLKGSAEIEQGAVDDLKTYSLQIYGDVRPQKAQNGLQEMQELINNFPELLKASNDGKGKPICYGLIPISVLQDYLGLPKTQVLWRHVNDDLVDGFVSLFDQIQELKQEMNLTINEIKSFQYCITDEDFKNAVKMKDRLSETDLTLRSELKRILLQARSGNTDIEELISLRSRYGTENQNLRDAEEFIRYKGFNAATKIDLAKLLQKKGIGFLKRGQSLSTTVLDCNHHLYIIYVSKGVDRIKVEEQLALMLDIQRVAFLMGTTAPKVELLYVDCEIHKEHVNNDKPVRISHHSNKKTQSDDVYSDMKDVSIAGVYDLHNNGNYSEHLKAIGLSYLKYCYVINASPRVTITGDDDCYEIKIETAIKNVYETIRPGEPRGSETLDGYNAVSNYELVANSLIQTDELSGVPEWQKIRTTIRSFTKDEMKVTLIANNVTATRVFKRVA